MKKKNLIFILSLFFLASCSTGGSNGSIAKPSVSNNSTNNSTSTSTTTSISEPSTSASISSPTTNPDEGYDETKSTEIVLSDNNSAITNNNGFVVISSNEIYITGAGTYSISGTLSNGKIIVNPSDEDAVIELELTGVNISCNYGAPIGIFNGDQVDISAKKGSKNYLFDLRTSDDDTLDGSNACLYSEIDLNLKGKGSLSITSSYNNGVGTKDDLKIKNLELSVKAPNNAIKGNDSLIIESGTITAISTQGDALKTSNSSLSSKGKEKGNITILDGTLNLYSACDAIDAARDVYIGDASTTPSITILTEQYSEYSEEVSKTSDSTLYLALNSSTISSSSYRFAAYFTTSSTSSFLNMKSVSNSGRFNRYTYYSVDVPSDAQSVTFYAFNSSQTTNSIDSYTYKSENMTIPTSNDMFRISRASGSLLSGSWTTYSTPSFGPGGPGGGMDDGNTNKADYSCKGIKADNIIEITSGNINIKSHDDGIHANNDVQLETGEYGLGNVTINGGNIEIYTDDDGVHADKELTINGGYTVITNSYEGFEGFTININGGTNEINSSDDGINASGGDERANEEQLNITGGVTYITANGDVIDSNGNINMTGGVVFAQGPSRGGNGLLDFDGTFTFSGGLLLGYGTSDMAQKPTASGTAKVLTPSVGRLSVGYYLNVVDSSSNIVASMKITMTNLSYCVLSYGSNYGTLSTSSSSTTSLELVKGLYYIA